MLVGMDFGTTNSGMAVAHEGRVQLLPLDPTNANPRVMRTALYVTNEGQIVAGRAAVDRYFADNIGRPIRLKKVWVGEIEVIASEVYYIEDLYVWLDVLSPGRLFLSMKTSLRDESYTGTVIGQFYYSLEDLIALFLTITRARAERQLDAEVRDVVLGRPVRFGFDAEHDALAEQRLLAAAFHAGYERVYLQYEPVAAATAYAETLTRPENVLVFDFGGGTLDTTIMRLTPGAAPRVLATDGIPVAGDVFDQKLSRARLPRYFGEGSLYGPRDRPLPAPAWIFDVFADWQGMIRLQQPENRRIVEQIAQTSRNPSEIQALLSLISGEYGLKMFDAVEGAKRTLSERVGAAIRLEGPGFSVFDLVTRRQFEQIIAQEIGAIDRHLDEIASASGLHPGQIDAVIRTGGSSQIPIFQEMLRRKFGVERQQALDAFSSVTAGLGRLAGLVGEGALELSAYTPADLADAGTRVADTRVPRINLPLAQRRVRAAEGPGPAPIDFPTGLALVLLGARGRVWATPWIEPGAEAPGGPMWPEDAAPVAALALPPDATLLALTSRSRFLMTTARQLIELETMELGLGDQYHFFPGEKACALADWDALTRLPWLVLVTSTGHARLYDASVLGEQVTGPVPLQFDDPLPGLPRFLMGSTRREDLLLATNGGRMVRFPLAHLPFAGTEVLRREEIDPLVGAVLGGPESELLLVTGEGYGRRLRAGDVSATTRPGRRGRSVLSRADAKALCATGPAARHWLLVGRAWHAVEGGRLPLEDSTRSHRLLRPGEGERVEAVLVSSPAAG